MNVSAPAPRLRSSPPLSSKLYWLSSDEDVSEMPMGKVASFNDPTGAGFSIITAAEG